MNLQNQKGFTLVEVILFFALSAGFIVVALMGISGRTANIQFTDSMRSLQSYLVSEKSKVINGVNSSTNSACSSTIPTGENEDCVLLGRVTTFTEDSSDVVSTSIYGNNLTEAQLATENTDIGRLILADPLSDGLKANYEISWETKFNSPESVNLTTPGPTLDGTNKLSIGWLRSPDSSRIVPLAFNGNIDISVSGFVADTANLVKGAAVDTRLCFKGVNNKIAAIYFDNNSSMYLIFDEANCK